MICNQICDWNDPSDGCVKPPAGFCPMCNVSPYQMPQTNADRTRAMSDEELANLLTDYSNNGGWATEAGRELCYERTQEEAEFDDIEDFDYWIDE